MTTYAQVFCTLAEIEDALKNRGAEKESFYLPKIEAVSQFMQMDFGLILPVTLARNFNGWGKTRLFIPPLLSATAIVNDGTSLVAADFIEQPDGGHWPNGPYSYIDVDPDATNLSYWVEEEEGISITGLWGLYNLVKSLGITLGAAQSTAAETTMQVSDGSKVSPGMVVVVESEQEYVESTNATPVTSVTTITEPITDTTTQTITLASADLVNVGEIFRIDLEKFKVLDKNDTTEAAYVERGWDKTIPATHSDNAVVDVYRKFNVTRGVNGTTAATHAISKAVSRQAVPNDIRELCVKMTARAIQDGQSGYSGVVGDPNTGESKYLFVKPYEYEEILSKYRIREAR